MDLLRSYSITAFITLLSLPHAVFAQQAACQEDGTPVICNPLEAESIQDLLSAVIDIVVTLSVPVIAVAIIYAGFLFVTAGGDQDQIEKAKRTALYTVIGAAIILGADVILSVLQDTASNLGADNVGN